MKTSTTLKAAGVAALLLAALSAVGEDRPAKEPTLLDRLEQALKADDKPFAMVIQIYIKPDDAEQFEAAAAKVAKASQAEKGCRQYDFNRDLEKPGHYTLVERWAGIAPLRKHFEQEHTKQILALFGKLSIKPTTIDIFAPVVGKE
jgi:quinol monooxygenase YgiN